MQRKDMADLIYLTAEEKYEAIVEDIKECVKTRSAYACRYGFYRELRTYFSHS
ncbi:hypothetical protein MGSAQ_001681 [marine sediment metagenome]|uniref:SecA C-terminal helicase domain-containing protein n=1 Tax=marine sediment metagenome TaxID=412755 RepID=A0A1B6NTL8_9ZZZZ